MPQIHNVPEEQDAIRWALQEQPDAIAFCDLIFTASQILDDLYDGDALVVPADIERLAQLAFVEVPRNPFYRAHQATLVTWLEAHILNWRTANRIEASGSDASASERAQAYVLRSSVSTLVLQCAQLIGGCAWADTVEPHLRRLIYSDHFPDYVLETF